MRTRHLAATLWWCDYIGKGSFDGKEDLDDIVQNFVEWANRAERQKWIEVAKRLKVEDKAIRAEGKTP